MLGITTIIVNIYKNSTYTGYIISLGRAVFEVVLSVCYVFCMEIRELMFDSSVRTCRWKKQAKGCVLFGPVSCEFTASISKCTEKMYF
jgi:hypothetical protein